MRSVLWELVGWQFHVFPFAFLGVMIGRLYLDVGAVVVPLVVVPILSARQAYASYLRLREANEAALATLVRALETKDRYTAGHAERVAVYASYIGEELGMRPRALERLRHAALMHDIGKLVVPNQLLNKPGRLTPFEYEVVRRHEDLSIRLLERIDFLAPVAPIAIGVYAPLAGDERRGRIEPFIIGVADAYDAMTSTRAYRLALAQEIAFAELRRHSGTQFHPRCVEALIRAIQSRNEYHGAGYESATALSEWTTVPPDSGPGSAGLGDFAVEGTR
jgi:response regulator RpfG family c-di-GMP phosphodiesterase